MKIKQIYAYRVKIPFRKPFRHATHSRESSDNIVVETILADGTRGWGEGLPRPYVTGETQESVLSALQNLPSTIFDHEIQDICSLVSFLDSEILSTRHFPEDRLNNTARCALELSILDAYLRSFRKTFKDLAEHVLEEPLKTSPVRYCGVLSMDEWGSMVKTCLKLRAFGFKDIKIKVNEGTWDSVGRLALVRALLGRKADLRVDANEAWKQNQAIWLEKILRIFRISSIEQPLAQKNFHGMKVLHQKSKTPLMLDESLCSINDAKKAVREGLCDLFNIRLSKCGGFINSLRLAQFAHTHRMSYQLGCLVGESGILSAAGRHFATVFPYHRYLEGSFDKYLLKDNLTTVNISFGYGGRARPIEGHGLGVRIDGKKLKQYTVGSYPIFPHRPDSKLTPLRRGKNARSTRALKEVHQLV